MVGIVAALILGVPWREIPLVMVGVLLPDAVEALFVHRFKVLPYRGSGHAVFLWGAFLILTLAILPSLRLGETVLRPPAVIIGALIHVAFSALGTAGVPLFPLKEKPRIALRLYRTGDVTSEETFAWIFIAAGVFLWLLKNH